MEFSVPEEAVMTLPFWNEEELSAHMLSYAERYETDIDDVREVTGPVLGSIDEAMKIVNTTKGLTADAWDLFYQRWQHIYLIFLNTTSFNSTGEDQRALIKQYFKETREMMEQRPTT